MNFGEHTAAVLEVLSFAQTGALLSGRAEDFGPEFVVTTDFAEAKDAAWEQAFGADEYTWTDLRELEVSEALGRLYELDRRVRGRLFELREELDSLLAERFASAYEEIYEDFSADLHNCARARAAFGRRSRFFEQQFKAMRLGGWSCGWNGSYPLGKMLVFCPDVFSAP